MDGYKVAEARARFGELLDQAEEGEPVVIERRGVRFTLAAERAEQPQTARGSRRRFFTHVAPEVLSGEWTWTFGRGAGLAFQPRRKRR